jgi:hypothetical protein
VFGIGPHIILDKSVLEMLSGDEFSLLTQLFRLVVPPVLIEEIIADLELKPTERRLPDVVVKRLAQRMYDALGYEPVDYAQAIAGNLMGHDIPMFGQYRLVPDRTRIERPMEKGSSTIENPNRNFGSVSPLGSLNPRM